MTATLYEEHVPFILILDNASYHKSAAANEFPESMDGKIILLFLPPYTPQMNPAEVRWRMVKNATAGLYPRTKEELHGVLGWMLKTARCPRWPCQNG